MGAALAQIYQAIQRSIFPGFSCERFQNRLQVSLAFWCQFTHTELSTAYLYMRVIQNGRTILGVSIERFWIVHKCCATSFGAPLHQTWNSLLHRDPCSSLGTKKLTGGIIRFVPHLDIAMQLKRYRYEKSSWMIKDHNV